jgi:C4-dicarboxylate-specific signal transduction histidine kinase
MRGNRILVADDDPINRELLCCLLADWGHEVVACDNGLAALEHLTGSEDIAVALLDWVMPGCDGVSVCRQLAAADRPSSAHRILLSAKDASTEIIEGLNAGANDYISKPFDPNELKARLNAGVQMFQLRMRLAESNAQLEQYGKDMEKLAHDQAALLVHADRLSTLGVLASGISQEIDSPAKNIEGHLRVLQGFGPELQQLIAAARHQGVATADNGKIRLLEAEYASILLSMEGGLHRIRHTIGALELYARRSPAELRDVELHSIAQAALDICQEQLRRGVRAINNIPSGVRLHADSRQLEQLFVNLIINSVHAMEQVSDKQLTIEASQSSGLVLVSFLDSGPGFSHAALQKIFSPFFTTKPEGMGTGLGLSTCQAIAQSHGGRIEARNGPNGGGLITLALPLRPPISPQGFSSVTP